MQHHVIVALYEVYVFPSKEKSLATTNT